MCLRRCIELQGGGLSQLRLRGGTPPEVLYYVYQGGQQQRIYHRAIDRPGGHDTERRQKTSL